MSTKPPTWSELKGRLKKMPAAALLGAIQDLYGLTKTNRAFLEARFLLERGESGMQDFRRRVKEAFSIDGNLNFSDARKAIRDYEAATSDLGGTLDLMLLFVEAGNWFTREFGDIDERFYDALLTMMDRFAKRLRKEDRSLYGRFAGRLGALFKASRNIGWGYSDEMEGIFERLRYEFEKQDK